jgi:hypothetical protein
MAVFACAGLVADEHLTRPETIAVDALSRCRDRPTGAGLSQFANHGSTVNPCKYGRLLSQRRVQAEHVLPVRPVTGKSGGPNALPRRPNIRRPLTVRTHLNASYAYAIWSAATPGCARATLSIA